MVDKTIKLGRRLYVVIEKNESVVKNCACSFKSDSNECKKGATFHFTDMVKMFRAMSVEKTASYYTIGFLSDKNISIICLNKIETIMTEKKYFKNTHHIWCILDISICFCFC